MSDSTAVVVVCVVVAVVIFIGWAGYAGMKDALEENDHHH